MSNNVEKIKQSMPSHFGHVQRRVIGDLLQYGQTARLHTYMKTQGRYTNYCRSIDNAIDWLTSQGVKIQYVPGKKGGDWTAYYRTIE